MKCVTCPYISIVESLPFCKKGKAPILSGHMNHTRAQSGRGDWCATYPVPKVVKVNANEREEETR